MGARSGRLLVYDGDCSFCASCVGWISRYWGGSERAVAWQQLSGEDLERMGLTVEELRAAAWWIDASGDRWRGHLAVARALEAARGWPAFVGALLLIPPFRWLAAGVYPLVARWRHRLPGGTPSCRM